MATRITFRVRSNPNCETLLRHRVEDSWKTSTKVDIARSYVIAAVAPSVHEVLAVFSTEGPP